MAKSKWKQLELFDRGSITKSPEFVNFYMEMRKVAKKEIAYQISKQKYWYGYPKDKLKVMYKKYKRIELLIVLFTLTNKN